MSAPCRKYLVNSFVEPRHKIYYIDLLIENDFLFAVWERRNRSKGLYFHDFAKISLSFELQGEQLWKWLHFFLGIQNGTFWFPGDVPRRNRRNSRCNRSRSVSKSYGTALQKDRSMCLKPAFPGESQTFQKKNKRYNVTFRAHIVAIVKCRFY